MPRKIYMPVKQADSNIASYMQTHVQRAEYADKIKLTCQSRKCTEDLPGTFEHYETYGNWCQSCNSKLRVRKLTETELNLLFRGPTNQLYHDIYKDDTDYETLQKKVTEEMEMWEQEKAQNISLELREEV